MYNRSRVKEIKLDYWIIVPAEITRQVTISNSIQGNISFNQIATTPNSLILTGLANHRLVTEIFRDKLFHLIIVPFHGPHVRKD